MSSSCGPPSGSTGSSSVAPAFGSAWGCRAASWRSCARSCSTTIDEPAGLDLGTGGLAAAVGVPLAAHGVALGALVVGTFAPRRFDDGAVELLRLAADRTAVAIEHARSFEAERQARERLEHVQTVTDAALAYLELDELLAVLLPKVREILHADTCAVLLLDDETRRAGRPCSRRHRGGGRAGRSHPGRRRLRRARRCRADADRAPGRRPRARPQPDPAREGPQVDARRPAARSRGGNRRASRRARSCTATSAARDVELLQLVAERVALAIERRAAARADGLARPV